MPRPNKRRKAAVQRTRYIGSSQFIALCVGNEEFSDADSDCSNEDQENVAEWSDETMTNVLSTAFDRLHSASSSDGSYLRGVYAGKSRTTLWSKQRTKKSK
jgi:hypothetical protein